MAVGIIGWDQDGQPIYGQTGPGGGMQPPNNTVQGDASGSGSYPTNQPSQPQPQQAQPRTVTPPVTPQSSGQTRSFSLPANSGDPWADNFYAKSGIYGGQIEDVLGGIPAAQNDANYFGGQGTQWDRFAVDQSGQNVQDYTNRVNGVMTGQRQQTGQVNQGNWSDIEDYTNYGRGLQANNDASYGNYVNEQNGIVAGLQDYQPLGYDQEGLAAQRQAIGQFGDIYGGSLDYTAAQAQASHAQAVMAQAAYAQTVQAALHQYQSNPGDVAQQQDAINKLKGAINGGEWNKNLTDVREKYKGLSDPEITDQERFIMEKFRQNNEGQMRSNREALSADQAARGVKSGASEQVGLGMFNQQTGQDRVLSELGAGANAIGRSMDAMQGWKETSEFGRQAELQAMGMYSDASGNLRQMNDNVGMFNTHEANTNSMFNAGETNATNRLNATNQTNVNMSNANNATNVNINNARNDTDVSMFNAGATNQASRDNQGTRLAGAQGYSDAASNLRNSNETINMFNKAQDSGRYEFNTGVKMDASNNKFTGNLATSGQNWAIQNDVTGARIGERGAADARNTRDNGMEIGVAGSILGAQEGFNDRLSNHGAVLTNEGADRFQRAMGGAGLYLQGKQIQSNIGSDAAKFSSGAASKELSAKIAKDAAAQTDTGGFNVDDILSFIPGAGAVKRRL